ncbi:MAG TPA: DUF4097 family beta strand repeat-containing protein [Opitutaceae bacterium]|jgi:hypothetical protein
MKKPIVLCLLAISLAAVSFADTPTESNTFAFADPSKPGTVRVTLMHGSVTVHGTDRADVLVRSTVRLASKPRPDGLRVLGSSSGLDVHQHGNTLVIESTGERSHGEASFEIEMPKQTALAVTTYGGHIDCSNIEGDAEVHSMSGAINLDHLSGGATIEASNGHVHAGFSHLRDGHPVSIMSLNGEVVLSLPNDAKANLQLRTQNGAILTDYTEQQLVTSNVSSDRVAPKVKVRVDSNDDDRDQADEDRDRAEEAREKAREIRDSVREATKEAQQALREAAQEARDGLAEAGIDLPPIPPLPPMTGGKTVSGVLNGGGIDVQVTTLNGDVTVKKATQ